MPQSPTIEPTDRSMPPVMMTKVMPIARIAFSATCLARIAMFATLRKFGAASAKKTKTAISAMKVRAFRSRRSAASPPSAGDGRALASVLMRASPRRRPARVPPPRPRRSPPRPPSPPSNSPVILPFDITRIRSESDITSSRSEVTNRIPSPSAASRRISRKTSALAPTSMPRDGSSISSTLGLVISALPITTFCWLPPESALIGFSGLATLIASSRTKSLHPRRPPPRGSGGTRA